MKLLEIKNNLVKLSYTETENPILGRFIVLASGEKSYVAQFVNLKSDTVNNFAIAKLLFTFTSDGVVDNYDGSIPNINSELSFLPAEELLHLLPLETAIKIGNLAQQEDMLNLDISVFERNLTIFADKDSHRVSFISNCIRQLFQMKEKSVIIDTNNYFEDYPKIEFTKDFKLPLNSKMIEYIFEYDLAEVEPSTKAVIQDIFYAVEQYIKTLDFEFLPIDNFVDVVANQYKEMQMPELALLKNKLLKYRDANVFANTKEEVLALKEKLEEKNCSIINLKDIHESLQKEVISFIHSTLEGMDKYIYLFLPLTDDNSDKKLLKQIINHNHVFTTILTTCSYKYASELKQHAQNMILFAPQIATNDFAAYNTFLNKLNYDECVVYGKLTQGIPFIVEMSDLDLDLTKDDVLGEKYQFVPKTEDTILVRIDDNGDRILIDDSFVPVDEHQEGEANHVDSNSKEQSIENQSSIPEISQPPIEVVESPSVNVDQAVEVNDEEKTVLSEPVVDSSVVDVPDVDVPDVEVPSSPTIVEPVGNIMEEDPMESSIDEPDLELDDLSYNEEHLEPSADLQESDLMDDASISDDFDQVSPLTEDDLNFIEDNQVVQPNEFLNDDIISEPVEEGNTYQESPFVGDKPPVVPVYPAGSEELGDDNGTDFKQGDTVSHPRYGRGVIEKIIKYGNKTLCSIAFDNVGRRLLDPSISELSKEG